MNDIELVAVPELDRETLRARGPDAQAWLNGLVSSDLAGVGPDRGAYGLFLTKQGKIQSDVDVVADRAGYLLSVAPGLASSLRDILDRHLVMEDAELSVEPDIGWVRLHGSNSARVALALRELPVVLATGAIDWLGTRGAAVAVPRSEVHAVAMAAVERGGPSAHVAEPDDWHRLRIAHGFPLFGLDYGSEDNAHEAAIERLAVSFTKGCYLGQEVVCMQDLRGKIKRRLVALRVENLSVADSLVGSEVTLREGGEVVGRVTSAVDARPGALVFARLKAPFFDNGAALAVKGEEAQPVFAPAARG